MSVSDIFYTNINRGVINDLRNARANYRNVGDTSRFQLAFSFRFGKSSISRTGSKNDSADEERNRVKL